MTSFDDFLKFNTGDVTGCFLNIDAGGRTIRQSVQCQCRDHGFQRTFLGRQNPNGITGLNVKCLSQRRLVARQCGVKQRIKRLYFILLASEF